MPPTDKVVETQLHREHVQKERRVLSFRKDFAMNPERMREEAISAKVNERDPKLVSPRLRDARASKLGMAGSSVLGTPRETPRLDVSQQLKGASSGPSDTVQGFLRQLDRPRQPPMERYDEPQTSSMSIGWDAELRKHEELAKREHKFTARWSRPRRAAEMSRFSERYLEMNGTSPFARKPEEG